MALHDEDDDYKRYICMFIENFQLITSFDVEKWSHLPTLHSKHLKVINSKTKRNKTNPAMSSVLHHPVSYLPAVTIVVSCKTDRAGGRGSLRFIFLPYLSVGFHTGMVGGLPLTVVARLLIPVSLWLKVQIKG